MGNRNLYIGISIILVALALFLIGNNFFDITGKYGSIYRTCNDSDGGKIYDIKGTVIYSIHDRVSDYTDYCFARTGGKEKYVVEYYCDIYDRVKTKRYKCESDVCLDGKCVPL